MKIEFVLMEIIIGLGLVMIIIGPSLFWIGYNSIDFSINLCSYIESSEGSCKGYADQTLNSGIMTFPELYMAGLKGIVSGFIISISGAFFLGVSLIWWITKAEENLEKK